MAAGRARRAGIRFGVGLFALAVLAACAKSAPLPPTPVPDAPPPATPGAERTLTVTQAGEGRLTWRDGLAYTLELRGLGADVGVYEGRPLRSSSTLSFSAWVAEWEANGLKDAPPTAVLAFVDASGERQSAVLSLSNPRLQGDVVEFGAVLHATPEGAPPLYPGLDLKDAVLVLDNQSGLETSTEESGIFLLLGASGALVPGGDRCAEKLLLGADTNVLAVSQHPRSKVRVLALEDFLADWAKRGFQTSPPRAALAFAPDDPLASARASVATLTRPAWSSGGAELCLTSAAEGSSAWLAPASAAAEGAVTVVLGEGQIHPSLECFSDADCEGDAACTPFAEGGFSVCTFERCQADTDCGPTEYCALATSPAGKKTRVCFPNETCAPGAAQAASTCSAPAVCDAGRCAPIGCDVDAECASKMTQRGAVEALCYANACQLTPHPYAGLPDQEGVLYGTTWSSPQLDTACVKAPGPALAELCKVFEFAVEDRALNVLGMLNSLTESPFSYYGRTWFNALDERGAVSPATQTAGPVATYPFPSPSLEQAIFAPLGIVDTAFANFTSRLAGDFAGLAPYRLPFSDAREEPSGAVEFLRPYFDDYKAAVLSSPPNNIIESGANIELLAQFGGGAGYGCFFGQIVPTPEDHGYYAAAPLLQSGGGFGFGLSESTGLDMGLGSGISFCTDPDCKQLPGQFYGGGGGLNWRLAGSEATDEDSEDPSGFVRLLNEHLTDFTEHDFFYLYCGSGAGLGFQARPVDGSGAPTSRYFTPLWDLGGGGNSWVIFKRVSREDAGRGSPLTDAALMRANAGFSSDVSAFLASSRSQSLGGDASSRPWNGARGVMSAGGSLKSGVAGSLLATGKYGFVYEPYHFALPPNLPLTSGAQELLYIPGSSASADLYYALAPQNAGDAAALRSLAVERATFELNVSPLSFDYASGVYDATAKYQWNPVHDLNADALALLTSVEHGGSPTDVTLTIPLYVQHDTSNESAVPGMISQNQWILETALLLAKENANVSAVLLGAGEHGVVQGFDASCNAYTFSQYVPPGTNTAIAQGSNNAANCTRYESSLTFDDTTTLLDYLAELISGRKKGGPNDDVDLSIERPLRIGINQKLDLPAPDGSWPPADTTGKDTSKIGWLTPTDTKQNGTQPARERHSLLEYWLLTPGDDKSTWGGVQSFLYELALPPNVTLHARFSGDVAEWAAHHAPSGLPDPDITKAVGGAATLSPIGALALALEQVRLEGASAGGPSLSGSTLVTGWFGSGPSGAATLVAGLGELAAAAAAEPTLALDVHFDGAFDQPWRSLPRLLPGMPESVCGHTYPLPHQTPDNPPGPPLPGNLPTECSPNFYGTPVPGLQPQPACFCLTNITDYPVTVAPFLSDLTPLAESGPSVVVPPNSVVTWQRGSNPAVVDPNREPPESAAAGLYDLGIAGKDGSFNLAVEWRQWPLQLVAGCKLWNGQDCAARNRDGAPASLGGEVPEPVAGEALPALRCVGVSDPQNGAGNANAGFQCPQVWFQFRCEGAVSGTPCPEPLFPDYSFPWGNDWQGDPVPFTWTAYDAWDLECKPRGASPLEPQDKSVTRIDPDSGPGGSGLERCTSVQWTAKGSGYDEVSGWVLKTLEAPQAPPGSTLRRPTAGAPKTPRGALAFEQAPMVILSAQEQSRSDASHEVSTEYVFCPTAGNPGFSSSNQFFPSGLTHGQYWFRVQPIGGLDAAAAQLAFLPSVDAIDVEFAPLCHQTNGTTSWQQVGKFTVDFPMPNLSSELPLSGAYSKVSHLVFSLPPLDGGAVVGSSFAVTPPVDNGIADFSLPGKPPSCADAAKCPDANFTTTMEVHFSQAVTGSDASGHHYSFGPGTPCRVSFVVTAGKDVGDQGGQAKLLAPAENPSEACFLELDNSKLFINGANFQFCGANTADLCGAPGAGG